MWYITINTFSEKNENNVLQHEMKGSGALNKEKYFKVATVRFLCHAAQQCVHADNQSEGWDTHTFFVSHHSNVDKSHEFNLSFQILCTVPFPVLGLMLDLI